MAQAISGFSGFQDLQDEFVNLMVINWGAIADPKSLDPRLL
ncbi:MAG: hypothetical protein ACKPJ4_19715 [Dolichospermum sp.]